MKQANFSHLEAKFNWSNFEVTAYFIDAVEETRTVSVDQFERLFKEHGDTSDAFYNAWLEAGSDELKCSECNGDGEYFTDERDGWDGVKQEYHSCEECDGIGKLEVETI